MEISDKKTVNDQVRKEHLFQTDKTKLHDLLNRAQRIDAKWSFLYGNILKRRS